jgi:hypothetical protein
VNYGCDVINDLTKDYANISLFAQLVIGESDTTGLNTKEGGAKMDPILRLKNYNASAVVG